MQFCRWRAARHVADATGLPRTPRARHAPGPQCAQSPVKITCVAGSLLGTGRACRRRSAGQGMKMLGGETGEAEGQFVPEPQVPQRRSRVPSESLGGPATRRRADKLVASPREPLPTWSSRRWSSVSLPVCFSSCIPSSRSGSLSCSRRDTLTGTLCSQSPVLQLASGGRRPGKAGVLSGHQILLPSVSLSPPVMGERARLSTWALPTE